MWETILNIVLAVLSVVMAGVTYYFDLRRKIQEQVNAEVSNAEDIGKKDKEKMAFVVEKLKGIIPKAVRFIFTDKLLENIVQKAFDKIEEYAQKQAAKKSK